MSWIRIDCAMKNAPAVHAIADDCEIRIAEAVGLVVATLAELPEHARDGDLCEISDRTLERWAGWEGPRGQYAQAFRRAMMSDDVVLGWDELNGAAMQKATEERERRKQLERDRRAAKEAASAAPTPDATPRAENVPDTNRHEKGTRAARVPDSCPKRDGTNSARKAYGTVRYGTVVTALTASADAEAVSAHEPIGGGGGDPTHRDAVEAIRQALPVPHHREALDCFVRASGAPDALVAELHAMASGMHGTGGRPVPWVVIGQALHEIRVVNARPSPNTLRGFVRKIATREADVILEAQQATRDPLYSWAVKGARHGDPEWLTYCQDKGIAWEVAA